MFRFSQNTLFRTLAGPAMAVAVALMLATLTRPATAARDPQALVGYVGAQGMAVLDPGVSRPRRMARLRELFDDYFDVAGLAEFALGPYRRIATANEQREFFRLYEQFTVETYGVQLSRYAPAPFRVTGSRTYGALTIVTSEIIRPDGGRVRVDWYLLINRRGHYKIADLVIAGISMKVAQRDQFARWIQTNGGRFGALLAVLRQQLVRAP